MPVRSARSANVILMVCAIGVPGCAIDSSGKAYVPERDWRQIFAPIASRASLDEGERNFPRLYTPLGNFSSPEPLKKRPENRDPRSLPARIGLARLDHLAGRLDQAEHAYSEIVQEHPGSPLARSALGLFYASESQWPAAAEHLGVAVELIPNDDVIRNHYAIALAYSGETKQALEEFTIAVGDAKAHYNMGYIQWRKGRIRVAEREFRRSLAIQPELDRARTMIDYIAATSARASASVIAANSPADHPDIIHASADQSARHATQVIWPESTSGGGLGNAFHEH